MIYGQEIAEISQPTSSPTDVNINGIHTEFCVLLQDSIAAIRCPYYSRYTRMEYFFFLLDHVKHNCSVKT